MIKFEIQLNIMTDNCQLSDCFLQACLHTLVYLLDNLIVALYIYIYMLKWKIVSKYSIIYIYIYIYTHTLHDICVYGIGCEEYRLRSSTIWRLEHAPRLIDDPALSNRYEKHPCWPAILKACNGILRWYCFMDAFYAKLPQNAHTLTHICTYVYIYIYIYIYAMPF